MISARVKARARKEDGGERQRPEFNFAHSFLAATRERVGSLSASLRQSVEKIISETVAVKPLGQTGPATLMMCSVSLSGPPGPGSGDAPKKKAGGLSSALELNATGNLEERDEDRILISEVEIAGADGALQQQALQALRTKPNFAYTIDEVREDVKRVFETGYFSSCRPKAEDTRDGVKLTIEVTPNPELRGAVVTGATRLPESVIEESFDGMRGQVLNLNSLRNAVGSLNAWYEKNGVLGQVVDVQMGTDDVARIKVGEALVNRWVLKSTDARCSMIPVCCSLYAHSHAALVHHPQGFAAIYRPGDWRVARGGQNQARHHHEAPGHQAR